MFLYVRLACILKPAINNCKGGGEVLLVFLSTDEDKQVYLFW